MARLPGPDLNNLTSPSGPNSIVDLAERRTRPPLLPPPAAPPVPQKALASLYAFGKSPAHFRICVIPASPTCFLKPSSLTHASFFLVPLMPSMALRCGACILAILHKCPALELPEPAGFLVVPGFLAHSFGAVSMAAFNFAEQSENCCRCSFGKTLKIPHKLSNCALGSLDALDRSTVRRAPSCFAAIAHR